MEEVLNVPLGEFILADAGFLRPLDYLVVHIGKVLDMLDLVALVFQVAAEGVENDVAEGVADVGGRVRRHPTDVHLYGFAVGRNEVQFLAGKGIV